MKTYAITLTEKECNVLFEAVVEYRDKAAAAVNTLARCGCCPAANQKTVEELNALVSKIALRGE